MSIWYVSIAIISYFLNIYLQVRLLLDRGAQIEEPNDEGYTPLMEAAREGHEVCVTN